MDSFRPARNLAAAAADQHTGAFGYVASFGLMECGNTAQSREPLRGLAAARCSQWSSAGHNTGLPESGHLDWKQTLRWAAVVVGSALRLGRGRLGRASIACAQFVIMPVALELC